MGTSYEDAAPLETTLLLINLEGLTRVGWIQLSTKVNCLLRGGLKAVTTSRIYHPRKLSLPQKGHMPPRTNTTSSNEVGERS